MKNAPLLLFLCCALGCSAPERSPAKQKESPRTTRIFHRLNSIPQLPDPAVFPDLDSRKLLRRLFDNAEIDSNGVVAWQPDFEERQILPVSGDAKCHTSLDTLLFFTDHEQRRCAVAIFATYYSYDAESYRKKDLWAAHFDALPLGAALFYKDHNDNWQLYCFRKKFSELGYFGSYKTGGSDAGTISLKTIGDRWTCLSLRQGIGGSTGVFWGYEQLFSIENDPGYSRDPNEIREYSTGQLLDNLFSFNYSESSWFDEKPLREIEREMKIIARRNDYSVIELKVKEDGQTHTEDYFFDELSAKFVLRR